ncbi:OmdA domain containing protein [Arthrobacter sp. MYb23]|uniref:YdeI/OmpD-associated family protein n=1 Tax=unclassified Arthrobacter TaxID=235627 RepID=UPI000CFDAFA4|nr:MULTISPECIES: YdeI/OmpD-associated family protein [unclassified Arthrobacter]PRB37047.1 OmdA domain containing protein [Arthrobacter sp. MYb51]PRB90219.1 OmdA domain containing protein [Arthrobacter sp. MYb23]
MEHEKTPEMLRFADGAEWEHWLTANHATEAEAWLVIGKKNSGAGLISIEDALDGALCFGWIDGQRRGHDEKTFLQRYSRRRARSSWSQVNVGKVEALIQAGRMQPAGLAEIDAAKADGRWEAAYVSQANAQVPEDLKAALAGDEAASQAFDRLGKTERYLIILQILKARTPEMRAKVLAKALDRLAERE